LLRREFFLQAELVNNGLRDFVAQELVEVHPCEARLLFGGLDVTQVLVQLDFVVLLAVGEAGGGRLELYVLLHNLLLQIRGVEFDQDLVCANVIGGHFVPLLDDLENLQPLVADADLALDLLGFDRLHAAAFEHGDVERTPPRGERGAFGLAVAAAAEPEPQ